LTPNGLVLLDKPAGLTSFAALGAVKRGLRTGRVGHAGTLDRFATGLLIALTGRLTRLVDLVGGLDKRYHAVLRLGVETDTLDPEGEIVAEGPLPDLASLQSAAAFFRGPVEQSPPAYSALHVNGRRAHALAREGRAPELPPRRVTIHCLEILRFEPPELELAVHCSKGTYVRSLARDLGRRAGSCAHLRSLRRVSIGPFSVEEALCPEEFRPERDLRRPAEFLPRLPGLRCLTLRPEHVEAVRQGRPMQDRYVQSEPESDGVFGLFDDGGALIAVARRSGGAYTYACVL
jgi:tRNA pseudouridine55 synthase